MANKKPKSSPYPQLTRILLKNFKLESFLERGKFSLEMKISKEIQIETHEPGEDNLIRLTVTIKLNGHASISTEEKKCLDAEATYNGRYVFAPEINKEIADDFLNSELNLDFVVGQVNSVALTHFKSQLEFAGYATGNISLNI